MNSHDLLPQFQGLRVADLRDGLDVMGYHHYATLSPGFRPLWRTAAVGVARTARYLPYQGRIPELDPEPYAKWSGRYYGEICTYPWVKDIQRGDFLAIDCSGVDAGLIGSENSLACLKNGAVGFVSGAVGRVGGVGGRLLRVGGVACGAVVLGHRRGGQEAEASEGQRDGQQRERRQSGVFHRAFSVSIRATTRARSARGQCGGGLGGRASGKARASGEARVRPSSPHCQTLRLGGRGARVRRLDTTMTFIRAEMTQRMCQVFTERRKHLK